MQPDTQMLAERRVCNICHESLAAHLELGDMAFHNDLTECLRVRVHPYCAEFFGVTLPVNRLVTDKRYSCKNGTMFAGNDEETALVRHREVLPPPNFREARRAEHHRSPRPRHQLRPRLSRHPHDFNYFVTQMGNFSSP